MEILQLKYFFESAKNESFAKTAEQYMVPTTSVSASIKRLEAELGFKLFDRKANSIALNSAGKRLQQALCFAFAEVDGALSDILNHEDLSREIKILVRSMRRKITDKIIEYKGIHPLVTFRISFDFADTEYENYDIIIDEETDNYNGYEKFEFFTTRLRIKCSENDPLSREELTMKQLSNKKFVSMGDKSNLHGVLMESCRKAGFVPDISIVCNDLECYEKFISSGMGIAIGRENNPPEQGVRYLNVSDFEERYTVYAYYRRDFESKSAKSFLDFLKKKAF